MLCFVLNLPALGVELPPITVPRFLPSEGLVFECTKGEHVQVEEKHLEEWILTFHNR